MKLQQFLCLILLSFITNQAYSQSSDFSPGMKLGLMAGYNNATAKDILSNNFEFNPVNGFYIGANLNLHLVKRFSLETGLLINQKGFEIASNTMPLNSYKLDYLSMQILGKIHVTKNIRLLLGSEASLLVTTTASSQFGFDPADYETADYSYLLGLEFGFRDKFAMNAKINNSISSVTEFTATDDVGNPIGNSSFKNRVFVVGFVFYPFRFEMF